MAFAGVCLTVAVTICLLSVTSGFYQRSVKAQQTPPMFSASNGAHQNPHQRASVQRTGDEPLAIDDVLRMGNEGHAPVSPTRRTFRDGREVIEDAYDMVLSPEQYRRLYQGGMSRNGGRTVATPWTDGVIPYYINTTQLDQEEVRKIKKGMETWQKLTCVQFRPMTKNDRNYAYINRGRGGCTADLGMRGGGQYVNLGRNCFSKSTIEHELGHTIGLIHEQQRPQRDGYIRVNYYAIEPNQVGWLAKYAEDSDDKMGLEYDYSSVMHYSRTAFSSGGRQTIYTRDPSQEFLIGNADGPSFLDAKLVNLMYKCQDRCSYNRRCGNDCFLTEDCKCFCKKDMPKEPCVNKDKNCEGWAQTGQCSSSGYVISNCKPACGMCEGPRPVAHGPCRDTSADCRALAGEGECNRNPEKMLKECQASCDFCPQHLGQDPTDEPGCVDYDLVCQYLADKGMCSELKTTMGRECAQHCGTCNQNIQVPGNCFDNDVHCWIWAVSGHCRGPLKYRCPKSCDICPKCEDRNENCDYWAKAGECQKKRGYMTQNCPQSCNLC